MAMIPPASGFEPGGGDVIDSEARPRSAEPEEESPVVAQYSIRFLVGNREPVLDVSQHTR